MVYKSLHSYKAINIRQTLCTFQNAEGKLLNRTLAVSVHQIEAWVKGVHIKRAMPELSTEIHNLFYNGSINNDIDSVFTEDYITKSEDAFDKLSTLSL